MNGIKRAYRLPSYLLLVTELSLVENPTYCRQALEFLPNGSRFDTHTGLWGGNEELNGTFSLVKSSGSYTRSRA